MHYLVFLAIALGGCALDLWTKHWIFERLSVPWVEGGRASPPIWLWQSIFGFETSLNEGALFGVGQGKVLLFATLSIVAAIGILGWLFWARAARDLHLTIALGFVMAGILGNLYDRLGLHGLTWGPGMADRKVGEPVYAVRDWLHFKIPAIGFDWPIFNVADSCLVCGAILLVWHAFRRPS
ncbi:MAG: signal peptidase II [Pirellulaceae bacterium]